MATFRFVGRDINIHWNGYDIKGPAGTVFSIPDQLYEEFESDLRGAEPSLEWIDTNEFLTLTNAVSVTTLDGVFPISVATTTSGKNVGIASTSALDGYVLTANGSGGVAWEPLPGDATGVTNIIGTSPISAAVNGTSATISLTANYQTAGNYVSSVTATSPITASLSTAGLLSVGINASSISAANAASVRTEIRNESGSTLLKGQVVYLYGSSGLLPTVRLALADDDLTSANTFGIIENDISNNTNGYVTNVGLLGGLNTSGLADGVALWLSPTIAGAVTTTKPSGPQHGVLVGFVIKGNTSGAGEIYVYIKNGSELDEIHDVNISGLANGQALIYSSTASVWQNKVLPVASVGASSPISSSTDTATGAVSLSISAASINSSHIANNAIVETKILDAAVTSAKIASGSINSTHIAANAVVAGDIAANAVTSGNIAAGSVGTVAISSGTATTGTVLTANGTGGASFQIVQAGVSTLNITANVQTANYTLLLSDKDKMVEMNLASALTITIPPNSTAAFDVGAQVHVLRAGAGAVTIAGGTGVTVNSSDGLKLRAQWSSATAIKRATNTWLILGDTTP